MNLNTYQVMPDLSPEDYAELKADIAKRGVMVPVEYDEHKNILDGHHRVRACKELGIIDWPRVVRIGMSEEQKREHARKLNMARRHLTREQRQELIRQQLKETPEKSDRQIATGLGVNHETVGNQRKQLESTGEIRQLDKTVGADGKERPRQTTHKPELPDPEELQEIDLLGDNPTPCDLCLDAHPYCDDCCSVCDDHCNGLQTCRLPEEKRPTIPFPATEETLNTPLTALILEEPTPKPITLYNPTKTEIETVKQFVETASPEIVQAVATGKTDIPSKRLEPSPYSEHETIRNNTDKAFSTIYDRVIYLSNDYSYIAQCLLENPNRTKDDTVAKLNECVERFQHIKAAVLKTTALKVVR